MRRLLLLGFVVLPLTACASVARPAPVLLAPSELPRLSGTWTGTIQPVGAMPIQTDLIVTTEGRYTSPGRIYGESGRLWILDDGRIGFESGLSQGVLVLHDDGTRRLLVGGGTYKGTAREFHVELTRTP